MSPKRDLGRLVGDLDNPFYAEERQRDVWNEASAVGFQTMLWGGLVLACAMVWVGGAPLVGWTIALLAVVAAASGLALAHANRLGVTGREDARLNRPRLYLAGAIYAATVVGILVRLGTGVDTDSSTPAGLVVGFVIGLAVVVAALWFAKRRAGSGTP